MHSKESSQHLCCVLCFSHHQENLSFEQVKLQASTTRPSLAGYPGCAGSRQRNVHSAAPNCNHVIPCTALPCQMGRCWERGKITLEQGSREENTEENQHEFLGAPSSCCSMGMAPSHSLPAQTHPQKITACHPGWHQMSLLLIIPFFSFFHPSPSQTPQRDKNSSPGKDL